MENSKLCPKCNSNNIVRVEGNIGAYGSGNNISLGATIFSAAKVTRFVCLHCGFSEEWLESEDLEKIKKKFKQS